ncbi:hypothetical protein XSR1_260042 [Xenorhabdus szentirmaii DSM 16338]|uniref:Uncharacterized protein n=1 Tax=Xenorhabdus szentirmaii DSM 16338 TaxID=1427518 RepID=W1IYP5_9GAMM|nr:hypothetical protein XSR1_260042 [Xenorhabdus szentirmaii DSM 16338]
MLFFMMLISNVVMTYLYLKIISFQYNSYEKIFISPIYDSLYWAG